MLAVPPPPPSPPRPGLSLTAAAALARLPQGVAGLRRWGSCRRNCGCRHLGALPPPALRARPFAATTAAEGAWQKSRSPPGSFRASFLPSPPPPTSASFSSSSSSSRLRAAGRRLRGGTGRCLPRGAVLEERGWCAEFGTRPPFRPRNGARHRSPRWDCRSRSASSLFRWKITPNVREPNRPRAPLGMNGTRPLFLQHLGFVQPNVLLRADPPSVQNYSEISAKSPPTKSAMRSVGLSAHGGPSQRRMCFGSMGERWWQREEENFAPSIQPTNQPTPSHVLDTANLEHLKQPCPSLVCQRELLHDLSPGLTQPAAAWRCTDGSWLQCWSCLGSTGLRGDCCYGLHCISPAELGCEETSEVAEKNKIYCLEENKKRNEEKQWKQRQS